jgi:hypothetical protein
MSTADNLFASTTQSLNTVNNYPVYVIPSLQVHNVVCRHNIAALLPRGTDMYGQYHYFVEAPKGYEGHSRMLRLTTCEPDLNPNRCSENHYYAYRYYVTDSIHPDPPPDPTRCRFESWLQHRGASQILYGPP